MSLREYIQKRDFQKSAEPEARLARSGGNRFVIQKHAASRLHYDFRLEVDGVLKSWAVPKGIPYLRGEKHLAVHVEDHPVAYIQFEGTIPKGQYGGGTVMVWDNGSFSPLGTSAAEGLKSGQLQFELDGKKLHGAWRLVRLRGGDQWLLIKSGDSMKPISQKMDDTSALSGKTMKQISENGAVWESKPREGQGSFASRLAQKKKKTHEPLQRVRFIEPMKARLAASAPVSGEWLFEIKFDGFRALAFKDGPGVALFSRNQKDFGGKFPEIADAIAQLPVKQAVIDGEIVALDKHGVSSFQLLQGIEIGERPPLYFYAFDLLQLNGADCRGKTMVERKAQLEKILKNAPPILRFSASLGDDAEKLLKQAKKLGLEGLIGKRQDSTYEAGKRSGAWIKLKLHRDQEFVIGGYTDPEGSREHFGALLVGFYEGKKLKFCGKVGTGFNTRLLASLHSQFKEIPRNDCPFANLPEPRGSRYSPGLTAAEMKRCHWVQPKMVCQIKFSEWTQDGKLRQPVFLGLREDKEAGDVVRETAKG